MVEQPARVRLPVLALNIAGMFLVMGLVLFLAAGTAAWAAGWTFLGLFLAFTVGVSLWLLRHSPGLLTERMTAWGTSDQQTWDKLFQLLASVLFLAWLVAIPLDAVRFRISHVPGSARAVAGVVMLGSFWLFFLVFRENAYLSPAVRLQAERAHRLVSTGPYRVVRHPLYATDVLFLVATTLFLGSWLGLVPVLVLVLAMAWRAVREEATLQAQLPGYADYMARVRYRMIPHVW